jgi:hypothetical protein
MQYHFYPFRPPGDPMFQDVPPATGSYYVPRSYSVPGTYSEPGSYYVPRSYPVPGTYSEPGSYYAPGSYSAPGCKKCRDLPPIDVESLPLDVSTEMEDVDEWDINNRQPHVVTWPGSLRRGDCTMEDRRLTLFPDGRAVWHARVKSSGSGDAWVFYGGISLKDRNGAILWTSRKLVGPQNMPEDRWVEWDLEFPYPRVWFRHFAKATIHRPHC